MIKVIKEKGYLVAEVTVARLDASIAADFKDMLTEIVQEQDDCVLLNLDSVDFMDSSGLAAIVYCFQLTEIKEELIIFGVQERVMRLFELTRMTDVVHIFKTKAEALAQLAQMTVSKTGAQDAAPPA